MDSAIEIYNDYAALIYKHPSIEACDIDNYKLIKATSDIECGELLILEHVFAAQSEICHRVVVNNAELFDLYHPRTIKHSECVDKYDQSWKKISSNCFGMASGNKLINLFIQQINHSCTATCAINVQENHTIEDTNVVFMELFAVKKISSGSEITINYGPETAHDRDFICDCGFDLTKRRKIFNVTAILCKALRDRNEDFINEKIHNYLTNPLSKKILLNQYLSVNGIYINKNTISGYNKDGLSMINRLVHEYMGITDDIITNDGKVIEQPINEHKIGLFLNILNNEIFPI